MPQMSHQLAFRHPFACCCLLPRRLTWAGALYDWLRVTEDRVLVVLKRSDLDPVRNAASMQDARAMFDFIIVSYDLLADLEAVLSALKLQVVVCDESHYIKTSTVGGWVGGTLL